MPDLFAQPTAAEVVAGMITGTATRRGAAVVRPVLVRLPLTQLMYVDAMAQLSGGKSRSQMVVSLLEAGIDAVMNTLPEASKARVHEVISDIAGDVVGDGDNESDGEAV